MNSLDNEVLAELRHLYLELLLNDTRRPVQDCRNLLRHINALTAQLSEARLHLEDRNAEVARLSDMGKVAECPDKQCKLNFNHDCHKCGWRQGWLANKQMMTTEYERMKGENGELKKENKRLKHKFNCLNDEAESKPEEKHD